MSFYLRCNKDWTVRSNQDWCVIDEEDKSGSDTSSRGRYITFTVDDGWDLGYYGTRNAVITVKRLDTGEYMEVNVLQKSPPREYFFNVSNTTFDVDPEGGTVNFTLVCNKDWTVKSNQPWCVIDEKDMSGGNTDLRGRKITFTVDDVWSAGYYGTRKAVITAKNTNTGESVEVNVSQIMSVLKVSATSFDLAPEGGTLSFDVDPEGATLGFYLLCNQDWTIESDADWCVIASSDRLGSDTVVDGRKITFTVADVWSAGLTGTRHAVISVKNTNTGESVEVNVSQIMSVLKVSISNFSVMYYNATYNFNLVCNTSWTVESDSYWCVVNEKSGDATVKSGKTVTFRVDDNKAWSGREAKITVKQILPDGSTSNTANIKVLQYSSPY